MNIRKPSESAVRLTAGLDCRTGAPTGDVTDRPNDGLIFHPASQRLLSLPCECLSKGGEQGSREKKNDFFYFFLMKNKQNFDISKTIGEEAASTQPTFPGSNRVGLRCGDSDIWLRDRGAV